MNTADAFIAFLHTKGYTLPNESPFVQFFELIFKNKQKQLKKIPFLNPSQSTSDKK